MNSNIVIHEGEPISDGICEESFVASFDGTRQTYLLLESRGSKDTSAPLLVLYLHGASTHQDQGMTAGIYDGFFERLWDWVQSQNGVYVCPDYRGPSWMGPAAEADVVDILAALRKRYPDSRVLLTGGSMGGTSALIFAARHPELLNGVYALCPATDMTEMYPTFSDQLLKSYGGSPDEVPEVYRERSSRYYAESLSQLPVAIIHGADDELIPVSHSRSIVEALRAKNANLQYVEVEGYGHQALYPADVPLAMNFLISEGASS
jgi:dipeptidyl aminopeptidase/acylaminoacyl peptidase